MLLTKQSCVVAKQWMKLSSLSALLSLVCATTTFAIEPTIQNPVNFASAEHLTIGDNVKIFFDENDPGQTAYAFTLANGLIMSYGDLLTMGDFYEVLGAPISSGKTDADRQARFIAAFNTLATNKNSVSEANQLMLLIHGELKMLQDGIKNGEKPEDIYKIIDADNNRKINCITGGGCDPDTWWLTPGRSLLLENDNYDHFGNNAWLSYQAGHEVAIQEAILAKQTNDKSKLASAYAMNAYASHFLTDRFSAGHIRTPRVELPDNVTPNVIGSILACYMHNEENALSLHVHNTRGDQWIAYGDKSYFNPNNDTSDQLILEAVQNSANEIFAAYKQGMGPTNDSVAPIVPQADEMGNAANIDVSPMFYWDTTTNQLMRRKDLTQSFDKHWTADWLGWSTLLELKTERGMPQAMLSPLIAAGLGNEAIQQGLITDEKTIALIKKR